MSVFVCFCTFLHTVRKNVEALWLWLCVWLPQEAKHHETTGLKWRHSASFKTSPKLHQQWQILKNEYDKFVRSSSGATCSRLTYRITSHKQNNARTRHQQHGWHAGGEKSQVLVSKLSYTDYIRLQWKKHMWAKNTYARETYLYGPLLQYSILAHQPNVAWRILAQIVLGVQYFFAFSCAGTDSSCLPNRGLDDTFFATKHVGSSLYSTVIVLWVVEERFIRVMRQGLQNYPNMTNTKHIF